jgi:hypothetical protein
MPKPMTRRVRRLSSLALAAVCFLGFDLFRAPDPEPELYVFAMSVQTDDGRLVGSPVVVGQAGGKVAVRLVCERDPSTERMSLTLNPLVGGEDGRLRYSYELNVPGRIDHERGTFAFAPGDEQRVVLRSADPSRSVTLALYAAPVQHPDLERYLKARRAKLARTAT